MEDATLRGNLQHNVAQPRRRRFFCDNGHDLPSGTSWCFECEDQRFQGIGEVIEAFTAPSADAYDPFRGGRLT